MFFTGHFEGSRPEWCISSMIYSRDTPFWSETLNSEGICTWRGEGGEGGGGYLARNMNATRLEYATLLSFTHASFLQYSNCLITVITFLQL